VPTSYPKCSPAELTGFVVLLQQHKGSEDVARLADDLDLEIDEVLPAVEFAEVLGLIKVKTGVATLTETGTAFVKGSIRERKTVLRDELGRTSLYRTLVRALDTSPEHALSDDQVNELLAFTNAPADGYLQNIINWGRYAELFRYDSDDHLLLPVRSRSTRAASTSGRPPAGPGAPAPVDPRSATARNSSGPDGPTLASFA
jgi:NitT/TauT family transport system ATP-binding protein